MNTDNNIINNSRPAYLLTCDKYAKRALDCKQVLEKVGFSPIIVVEAIPNSNKVLSNKLSMQYMCKLISSGESSWGYIFEDDIDILCTITIDDIINYETYSNKIMYLGCCVCSYDNIYIAQKNNIYKENNKIKLVPIHYTEKHKLGNISNKCETLFASNTDLLYNNPLSLKITDHENRSHLIHYIIGGCRGAHAFGLSRNGAKELLDLSNKLVDITKYYNYMDVIIEEYVKENPAVVIRFELMSYISGHHGAFYQDRIKYPSTIS
jgi:hypothetical protein